MDVDTTHPTPLSAELEQINLEITNAQISQKPPTSNPSGFPLNYQRQHPKLRQPVLSQ